MGLSAEEDPGCVRDNAELLALLRVFQPRSKKRDNVRAAEDVVRQDGLPTIHSGVSGFGKFHAGSTAGRWRGWTAWAKGAPCKLRWTTIAALPTATGIQSLALIAPLGLRPIGPALVANFGHILAVLIDVAPVLDQLVAIALLCVGGPRSQSRHAFDDVHCQMKAIEPVEHRHVERGGRRPFFNEATDVDVVMVGAIVG